MKGARKSGEGQVQAVWIVDVDTESQGLANGRDELPRMGRVRERADRRVRDNLQHEVHIDVVLISWNLVLELVGVKVPYICPIGVPIQLAGARGQAGLVRPDFGHELDSAVVAKHGTAGRVRSVCGKGLERNGVSACSWASAARPGWTTKGAGHPPLARSPCRA